MVPSWFRVVPGRFRLVPGWFRDKPRRGRNNGPLSAKPKTTTCMHAWTDHGSMPCVVSDATEHDGPSTALSRELGSHVAGAWVSCGKKCHPVAKSISSFGRRGTRSIVVGRSVNHGLPLSPPPFPLGSVAFAGGLASVLSRQQSGQNPGQESKSAQHGSPGRPPPIGAWRRL